MASHMDTEQQVEYVDRAHAEFLQSLMQNLDIDSGSQHPIVKAVKVHIETSRLLLQKWVEQHKEPKDA
jgi:hypothetical protein